MLVLSLQLMLCFQSCSYKPAPLPAHQPLYSAEKPVAAAKKAIVQPTQSREEGLADARAFLKDASATTTSAKKATITVVDDLTFVRRIYLDLTGKLPLPDQVDTFVIHLNTYQP